MQQVPNYLIVGNGRVSRHFQFYFSQLNLPFHIWQRSETAHSFNEKLAQSSHILLLISDNAIENFITDFLQKTQAICVHFSGSLISNNAYGAHPLMTFSETLYTAKAYHEIPFIIDHDAPDFEEILPGLTNKHVRLHKSLKAKYHALCVLSGNFSCLLWQKLFHSFQHEFNLSESFAYPYLQQQTQNLMTNSKTALTGPLVRNDQLTIDKNLDALDSDSFKEIYESFVSCYQKKQGDALK